MSDSTAIRGQRAAQHAGTERVSLKALVGSGDRIGLFMLPFLAVGITANVLWPDLFSVGGPAAALRYVAIALLAVGVMAWAWSVALILTKVPRRELITAGPFALVKHPLYTGVALLVIPAVGLLLDSWLGVVLGGLMYLASRRYAPAEEQALATEFGAQWDEYAAAVKLPWM